MRFDAHWLAARGEGPSRHPPIIIIITAKAYDEATHTDKNAKSHRRTPSQNRGKGPTEDREELQGIPQNSPRSSRRTAGLPWSLLLGGLLVPPTLARPPRRPCCLISCHRLAASVLPTTKAAEALQQACSCPQILSARCCLHSASRRLLRCGAAPVTSAIAHKRLASSSCTCWSARRSSTRLPGLLRRSSWWLSTNRTSAGCCRCAPPVGYLGGELRDCHLPDIPRQHPDFLFSPLPSSSPLSPPPCMTTPASGSPVLRRQPVTVPPCTCVTNTQQRG